MKVKILLAVVLCFAGQALALTAGEARAMEETRNAGQYEMEGQTGPEAEKFSSFWQMPESDLDPKWGTDVMISPSDSVYAVSLARDPSTGNLFAVLSRLSATSRTVSVHFSSNGGLSWSNTYNVSSVTGRGASSAMVMGNYCYYAYSTGTALRVRRVSRATGANVNMGDGTAYFQILTTTTDTITEVSMAELFNNTQLCLATLHKDGKYRLFWTYDTGGVSWTQMASPDSTAKGGLDIYGNYPYSNYLLFSSYYNKANQLRVLGLGPGGVWDTLVIGGVDSNANFTAVGSYRDTVLVAFETVLSGYNIVAYKPSYDGGSTWGINYLLSDPDSHAYCPDFAARGGGGIGAVYMQYPPFIYRFKWRPYSGPWNTPVRISTIIPSSYVQPAIEYLDGGAYGIAFVSSSAYLNKAYFDRSDWVVGVEDQPENPTELTVASLKLKVAGNKINYQLPQGGIASLKIYNLLGQEVRTLINEDKKMGSYEVNWDGRDAGNRKVASGVYLVRLVSDGQAVTAKMIIVR